MTEGDETDETAPTEGQGPEADRAAPADRRGSWGLRLLALLPVAIFMVLATYFLWGLQPDRNPRDVPSALVDKPVPRFDLAAVPGLDLRGVSTEAIASVDGPVILNVFASWCAPCRIEHPIWMRLADNREVPIYGINYKDAPADARQWLSNYGNPYDRVGAMPESRANVGIDLGIYGVPETYLIGPDGIIRYKHAGPVTGKVLKNEFLPRLKRWRHGPAS